MAELNELTKSLDELLSGADLSDVTADGLPQELPDGYYLCEVEKAELKPTKQTGMPMVSFQYSVVEDGLKTIVEDNGDVVLKPSTGTKGRKVFMNYVLKDVNNPTDTTKLNRFVADMLKFEDPTIPDQPLLNKEYFTTSSVLLDALDILSSGSRIYVMVQTRENTATNEKSKKYYLITWKRVKALELPM